MKKIILFTFYSNLNENSHFWCDIFPTYSPMIAKIDLEIEIWALALVHIPVSIMNDKRAKNIKSVVAFIRKRVLGTSKFRYHFEFLLFEIIPFVHIESTASAIASCDKIVLSLCFIAISKIWSFNVLRVQDSPIMEYPPILASFKNSAVFSWLMLYAFEMKLYESSSSSMILFSIMPWSCWVIWEFFSDLSLWKIVFINTVAITLQ